MGIKTTITISLIIRDRTIAEIETKKITILIKTVAIRA